jgi:extracellular elastinolytic metalloproteinase
MSSTRLMVRALSAFVFACLVLVPAAPAQTGMSVSDIARDYAREHKQSLGLTGSDLNEVAVSSEVKSKQSGVTHVYLQQRYRGIDVEGGIMTVNVAADGKVLGAGSRFVGNIASSAGGQNAKKAATYAVQAAAAHLKLKPNRDIRVLEFRDGPNQAATLSDGGISRKPIEAQLVWLPMDDSVRLAWKLEIEEMSGEHWWYAFVDAVTGAPLAQQDLVVHDSASAIARAIARPTASAAARRVGVAPLPAFPATDGATYRVFPIPLESPSIGGRELVSNAADPAASPFGWHDTDGAAGPEFTTTRGNNVHAYADRDNNNQPDPGSDPDGGPTLNFDFPLDLTSRPLDSQPAMVTNLFYWNNIMHDVTYGYGFDEASGNFQQNNYGNGGLGADYVRAEAQDGSGRNNANFSTPTDGNRPRMQMFEWRSSVPNPITVATPSPIAGIYYGPMAGFGESLVTTGPISGTVFLVNDGVGTVTDGCEPFAVPPGGIPLIDRGACNFTVKVKNAQDAGAATAIVADNIPGEAPFGMGGADPTVTVPSVMISFEDGALFKANLPLDAMIADGTGGAPDRDSDIDSGVISHEYGHGVSNRLTGGPATASCLGNAEQMGEGWSDWFALNLTSRPSDTPTTPRGVGTYVSFQPPDDVGIRPTPYTTDMSVNPSTYASVADVVNISQPHGIGYVWTSMLWEVYWNLVDRYGYNSDIYGDWTTGGNNLAMQLVMDGLKTQVCRPGFVDGRDAILQSDMALTGGANQCEIWRGFAKRGLGFSANQGSSNNRSDGVEAFDLPAICTAATFGSFDPPVAGAPVVNIVNAGSTVPLKFSVDGVASVMIDSEDVDCATLLITGAAPVPVASPAFPYKNTEYHVNWQTDNAWAGTCRRLTVRIPAAADAVAFFSFH